MATQKQVESKLRQLIGRLDKADEGVRDKLTRALPNPRIVQIEVSDIDAAYWTELGGGHLGDLHPGRAPDPDIRMTSSSDDLVAMVDGTKSLFSSYLAGHVKVQASISDLLALRRML